MQKLVRSIAGIFALMLQGFTDSFVSYGDDLIHQLFDVDRGQLKHIPNFVIFLIYLLCVSVLFQAGLDFVIEVMMLAGYIEAIPLRVDFIFLTLISTVIGIQTIKGMSHQKLDVTRNSILIGIIVEVALIVGDMVLIVSKSGEFGVLPMIRLPFLMLTFLNLSILLYVGHRLRVFRDYKGRIRIF